MNEYKIFSKSVWYLGAPCAFWRSQVIGTLCAALSQASDSMSCAERYYVMQKYLHLLSLKVRSGYSFQLALDPSYSSWTSRATSYGAFGRSLITGFYENGGYGPLSALHALARLAGSAESTDMTGSSISRRWGVIGDELHTLSKGTMRPSSLFVSLVKSTSVLAEA